MKNTFEIISNTFHSVKPLIYLLVIVALLALTTTAFAQTCPIKQGLYKSTSIGHIYDDRTQVYTKIYATDLGTVTLIMNNVSVESYKLHRYSYTVPTSTKDIIVKWNNKLKRFSHTEILKSTKQL